MLSPFLTEKASSDLLENVILTTEGTKLCLTDTGANKGGTGTPRGRTILTNMKNVCAPRCVP